MSDTVNFDELNEQHLELLPARTVLSTFSLQGADGGIASDGADATGSIGGNILGMPMPLFGDGNATGASGASADG